MNDKSVLISIQPKWCELIVSGKKTIEVRKTKPTLKPPFKCYIYCCKAPKGWIRLDKNAQLDTKIIGEFVCDEIYTIVRVGNMNSSQDEYRFVTVDNVLINKDIFKHSRLTPKDIKTYLNGLKGYGWHISDLKIYDESRKLSEFANSSSRLRFSDTKDGFPLQWSGLQKPPQSWCYVKEVQNNVKP